MEVAGFGWIAALHGAFSQPRWLGQDICEKTILIYTEQGLRGTSSYVLGI